MTKIKKAYTEIAKAIRQILQKGPEMNDLVPALIATVVIVVVLWIIALVVW